jgi:hypothetical protein
MAWIVMKLVLAQFGPWLTRRGRTLRTRGPVLLGMAVVLSLTWASLFLSQARAGEIAFVPQRPADSEPLTRAWLIQRDPAHFGDTLPVFLKPDAQGVIHIDHLAPGVYDLKFQAAHGLVMGWDAHVPASDYETEQPLSEASRKVLLEKLAQGGAAGFDDQVAVLDIQGNIQNAAILTRQLRTRPFVGGHYKPGEWVFRATRWQWEAPQDVTWAPYQEQPFYALLRQRLVQKSYEALNITFARHLGGIHLATANSRVDLGKVLIPEVQLKQGVIAVNSDGSMIEPVVIKPAPAAAAAKQKGS